MRKHFKSTLKIYSNYQTSNFRSLLEKDVTESTIQEIFNLSNSNPRDLWGLDEILHEFVCQKISFYEHCPRRKNARKNTNDIYSNIKHLSSLNSTDKFTNDHLHSCDNTVGSTTNNITEMIYIELVENQI